MSESTTSRNVLRRLRWAAAVFACLAAVLVIGLLVYLGQRASVAPLAESPRKELVLRDGRLFLAGNAVPFTGLVTDTYDGGELKSRSVVSNGWLQGLSKGWHTNGQQQVEEHFVAGTSHGLRTKWHANGQKLSEVPVAEGKLSGTYRSWHENGERAEELELKDGQPDGLSRAWFPSGFQKSQVTLRNGKVVDQKFWKDGEFKKVAVAGPGLVSGN